MHFDFGLQHFLLTVLVMVVVGLPLIVLQISLPAQLQFEELSQDQLSPRQAEYFDEADTKLSDFGYHPLTTFRVVNLPGANLSRLYASSSDPARILVSLMSAPGGKMSHNYAEILSKYRDGTILATKNSNVSTVFEEMPGHIVQAYPEIHDLAELKRRHDTKAETLVQRGRLYRDNNTFFSDFNDFHKRFCTYQQSKKLLRHDERAGVFRATVWTGLRGIRNFLNPLADNFTALRFAEGALLGALPPLLVLYRPGPLVDWIRSQTGLDPSWIATGLLMVAFSLGGVTVGYLFRQKSFIWAFLLGYVPTKLLAPAGEGKVVFCLWMAFVADRVSRWRMRREKYV